MQTGTGQLLELIFQDGLRSARISCPASLIPAPGQYIRAELGSDSLLPVPLFYTDSSSSGFIAAPPFPDSWQPGQEVYLRGPLGRGFTLPVASRQVALVAYDDSPARLLGLIRQALHQDASLVLVSNAASASLPDEVEVQPLSALIDVCEWADYIALDVLRENLPGLRERLGARNLWPGSREAQVLVRTPMPCGGVADCGVCAVTLTSGWRMACKDGPVFDWREVS
jgi:dihydroorotate dehydrogenase electron transfer subunit